MVMTGIEDVEKAMAVALGVPGFVFEKEQADALQAPMAPQIINAGAGTGKTTVMAGRVVWLAGTGQVEPSRILALTFTRKAAQELGEDIASALEAAEFSWDGLAATYDSFASTVVEEFAVLRGWDSSARLVDGVEPYMVADQVLREAEGDFPLLSLDSWAEVVKGVVTLDSHLHSHLLDVDEVVRLTQAFLRTLDSAGKKRDGGDYVDVTKARPAAEKRLEYLQLVNLFRQAKTARGIATFADRMAQAVTLAEGEPRVCEMMRERYRVVLLDEYQDTSVAQARFLSALFVKPLPNSRPPMESKVPGAETGTPIEGAPFPVTAVGDPLQAIYGWRGAGDDTLAEFRHFFGQAGEYSLVRNRRSGQAILDAANAATAVMPQAYLTKPDSPHTSRKLRRLTPLANRKLQAATDKSARVEARQFETWPQEATWIAADIEKAAHERHTKTRDDGSAWVDYGDFAILVRRRSEIGALRIALDDLGIPVAVQGLAGLTTIPLVSQVIAMMKILTDPDANPEILEILSGPRFLLERQDLEILGRHARDLARLGGRGDSDASEDVIGDVQASDDSKSENDGEVDAPERIEAKAVQDNPIRLIDAVLDEKGVARRGYTARGRLAMGRLADDLRAFSHLGDDAVAMLSAILDRCGVLAQAQFESEAAVRYVRHFVSLATRFCADHDSSLNGLLAYLAADEEYGEGLEHPPNTAINAVVISTVHGAKGLDWDEVYLPALCQGVFPNVTLRDNPLSQASVLPTDSRSDRASLPTLADYEILWGTKPHTALTNYKDDLRNDARASEDRLAYVAITRPKTRLVATCHVWGSADLATPRDPSEYFHHIADVAKGFPSVDVGGMGESLVCEGAYIHLPPVEKTEAGTKDKQSNPLAQGDVHGQWPAEPDNAQVALAMDVRAAIQAGTGRHGRNGSSPFDATLASDVLAYASEEDRATIAAWDDAIEAMRNESIRDQRVGVPLPTPMSASFLLGVLRDPQGMAREVARPMPIAPKGDAVLGSGFHSWVERHYGQAALFDSEEVVLPPPGLEELKAMFLSSQFASASPRWVEKKIDEAIAGRVISGRIDAVFCAVDNPGLVPQGKDWLIVDWKTGKRPSNPVQLGLYAHGLAHEVGVPMSQVAAGFFHVATSVWEEVRVPSSEEVERLVSSLPVADS